MERAEWANKPADRAINALCSVVEAFARPVVVASPRSGLTPEDLRDMRLGDLLYVNNTSDVKPLYDGVSLETVELAIKALSYYVMRGDAPCT